VEHEVFYYIPTNDEDMRLVREGKKTFFEAEHGGAVQVLRIRLRNPEWDPGLPSGQIGEGEVAGFTTAIGTPVLPEGWGTGFILVFDPETRVLTRVDGVHLTVAELERVAEGILE
jgi:hypothetical protein